jgi:hypothetical protein
VNTQQLWQAQALDAPRISLAFVRQQSDALRHRTQMRNAFEYIATAAAGVWVVWSGWSMLVARPLMLAAIGLWIASGAYVMFRWHRLASSQERPADFGVLDALRFHRRQLERQRDARRGNWRWWLPPMVPVVVMICISLVVEFEPVPWKVIGAVAVWVVFGSSMAIVMYERSARRIQREIDALDSL